MDHANGNGSNGTTATLAGGNAAMISGSDLIRSARASAAPGDSALVEQALSMIASAGDDLLKQGAATIEALLTFKSYANDRVGGQKTETYQCLVSKAHPILKSGKVGFKDITAFLTSFFSEYLGALDSKGKPDKGKFQTVKNAWDHDRRQGDSILATGGPGKGKKKSKPVKLSNLLAVVEKKFPKLKKASEIDTLYQAVMVWYGKATGAPGASDPAGDQ